MKTLQQEKSLIPKLCEYCHGELQKNRRLLTKTKFHQFIARVANQSETKSHISSCATAKSHIIHTSTHEHHPIFPH